MIVVGILNDLKVIKDIKDLKTNMAGIKLPPYLLLLDNLIS